MSNEQEPKVVDVELTEVIKNMIDNIKQLNENDKTAYQNTILLEQKIIELQLKVNLFADVLEYFLIKYNEDTKEYVQKVLPTKYKEIISKFKAN